jgi:uncharacterized protein YjbI with pentapeptide repeats
MVAENKKTIGGYCSYCITYRRACAAHSYRTQGNLDRLLQQDTLGLATTPHYSIPLVLALIALLFNRATTRTERQITEQRYEQDQRIAQDRQLEDLLQSYLNHMSELLLEKQLRTSPSEEVKNVARVRTISVLTRLDARRASYVFAFLRESGLMSNDEKSDKVIIKKPSIVSLDQADLRNVKWSRADLGRANLNGVDLSHADLTYADLSHASLGADLRYANLEGANLTEADLSWAELDDANLEGANLFLADLSHAKSSRGDFFGASLQEADLSHAIFDFANLKQARLIKANLNHAYLEGVHLSGADLIEANLTEANLTRAKLQAELTPTLVGILLWLVKYKMPWNSWKSRYSRENPTIFGADLSGADLSGANLTEANLKGATGTTTEQLEKAKSLKGTTMPDGSIHP